MTSLTIEPEALQSPRNEFDQPATSTTGTPFPPASTPARDASAAQYDLAIQTVREAAAPLQRQNREAALADAQRNYSRKDLENQQPRRWRLGNVYAPHDLSGVEAAKWKKLQRNPRSRGRDILDQLGMKPLEHYKNFSVMSEYITDMGRIRHGDDTGLRPVNQRKMAKAVRRAIGIGLMPSVHRHPEILRIELNKAKGGNR